MTTSRADSLLREQTIEQLQERYGKLHTKKIQAETNLENAKKNLDALREEARQKFGTDDLDELRKKLNDMKAENEQKRRKYQDELDEIETNLANVEKSLASAESADKGAKEDS